MAKLPVYKSKSRCWNCGADLTQKRQQNCGAKKGNGTLCERQAGWQTDHPGFGHCRWHGGRSPGGKKYAARLRMEYEHQQALEDAQSGKVIPLPDNPEDPKQVIRWLHAMGVQRVAQLETTLIQWEDMDAVARSYAMNRSLQERNHLSQLSTQAHKLAIDERSEAGQIASLFLWVFESALEASGANLTSGQVRAFMNTATSLLREHERSPLDIVPNKAGRPTLTTAQDVD